jgi:hypothetical protein
LIVKGMAIAVIVASLVGARVVSDGQAALFFTFAVASLILFVLVLFDFDTWVESVPPMPKGTLRRWIARGTRRIRRAVGWVLALYAGAMTWFWSTIWHALVWVLARTGNALTHVWVGIVRGGSWVLVRYRAAAGWVWSTIGRGFAWMLVHGGEVLTHLWVAAVRGGGWVGVRYRAAAGRVWSSAGRGLAHLGAALTVAWNGIAHAGAWSFARCRAGIRWAWLAIVGRGDEPTPKPIRRWYTATVDAAFGIPPDDTKVDVFGGRIVPPRRDGETVGAPSGRRSSGTRDDAAL